MGKTSRRWTIDEDDILMETVSDYVKQGKSKVQAYRDLSSTLDNRTYFAISFRFEQLKNEPQYKHLGLSKPVKGPEPFESYWESLGPAKPVDEPKQLEVEGYWDDVIERIVQMKNTIIVLQNQITQYKEMEKQIEQYREMEKNYHLLLKIMEKARKQVLEIPEGQTFTYDEGGSLKRIE